MTPCHRLPSILAHGAILSWSERQGRGIEEPEHEHYWGAEGRKEAFSDVVCCAFMAPWGMLKQHGEEFAIVILDAEGVCSLPGVLFCPTNSARSDYTVDEIRAMSEIEAFEACFPNPETYGAYKMAEIMVPSGVPLNHARGLIFCDNEARDYWVPALTQISIPADLRPSARLRVSVGQLDRFRFPGDYEVTLRVRP